MKPNRKYILLFLSLGFLLSCSDDHKGNGGEEEIPATDLSAEALANCYIVQTPGTFKFKADNMFNLGEGLPVPPVIEASSASLIWQTNPGLIKEVELKMEKDGTPYVYFNVEKPEGNALIGVKNHKGEIEWSWHIWMPKVNVSSVRSNTEYEIMNLNLGAVTYTAGDPDSYGMLYQWGRKDPFPTSATLTGNTSTVGATLYDEKGNIVEVTHSNWMDDSNNTIEYSLAHPTEVISNNAHYQTSRDWLLPDLSDDSLWGNPYGDYRNQTEHPDVYINQKTCYDPSPAGWRVAPADAFRDYTFSGGYAWTMDDFNVSDFNEDGAVDLEDYNYGWWFNVNDGESMYYPAAGRYDGTYAMLMGSVSGIWGNYWSSAPYSNIVGGGFCALSFQVKGMNGEDYVTVSPAAGASRADAYSVRCVRDF